MAKRIGVLIGRFQGYHTQHHEHLRRAALESDLLVVIIGSPNVRKSIKNPWSWEERASMIEKNIQDDPELASCRIVLRTTMNHPDNKVWAKGVKHVVNQFVNDNTTVTLYGCNKDASSFYLDLFPEWEKDLTEVQVKFDATQLRKMWFEDEQWVSGRMFATYEISDATLMWLHKQPYNEALQEEWEFYQKETERFANYPFPETLNFNCADAVVVCHGQVLMIRRKFAPGKGCLALPGGFKNRDERFFDGAVRELYEETGIDIPYSHLIRCLVKTELFDDPSRSLGIPRNSLAAYFDVSKYYMDIELPITKAADDAAEVEWVPVRDVLYRTDIYDDHAAIVYTMTKEN